MATCDLSNKNCVPCEGEVSALSVGQVNVYLESLKDWRANSSCSEIYRTFVFKNYYQVMAFVNAVAFIAHQEKHHPDLEVHYNKVVVRYGTHAIQGLSENDFICALKVNALLTE